MFCPEPGSSASSSSSSSSSSSAFVGRWPRALFDDLAARVEPPDPRNRWEQPLFVADARRAKTEEESGLTLRPAPASLPAGGRGGAPEETRGWPLDAVAAAVVAAVAAPGRGGAAAKKKAAESSVLDAAAAAAAAGASTMASSEASTPLLPETLPLATASVALRPAKCTLAARVAGADALGDLDAAAQAVLLAVAAALSRSRSLAAASSSAASAAANGGGGAAAAASPPPSEASAFAAIEIPLSADDGSEGDAARKRRNQEEGEDPLTLSLQRAPSLAELRRHKRDFLRAATAPMAGPLPSGARAGASAFCEYLKRRVV